MKEKILLGIGMIIVSLLLVSCLPFNIGRPFETGRNARWESDCGNLEFITTEYSRETVGIGSVVIDGERKRILIEEIFRPPVFLYFIDDIGYADSTGRNNPLNFGTQRFCNETETLIIRARSARNEIFSNLPSRMYVRKILMTEEELRPDMHKYVRWKARDLDMMFQMYSNRISVMDPTSNLSSRYRGYMNVNGTGFINYDDIRTYIRFMWLPNDRFNIYKIRGETYISNLPIISGTYTFDIHYEVTLHIEYDEIFNNQHSSIFIYISYTSDSFR